MNIREKAFLFDVDGVLIASHELQATALAYAMSEIAKKYKLEFHPNNGLADTLFSILIGGTENTAIKKTLELFPVFQEYKVELFKSAWEKYYQLATEADNFKISESINLLKILQEIGYKVCLVSSSKQKDIALYCKILGLETIVQTRSYICFEDINNQAKPSPFPYILAAQKLGVSPSNCIVFEDSENGVIAAKQAGMYAVGLHRYPFQETLSKQGADEVVSNVFQARILAKALYAPGDLYLKLNNVVMRVITLQEINKNDQESIVCSTYEVYKNLLSGHSLNTWRNKLIDEKDVMTRIGLFYSDQNLVGYAILKFREVSYSGESRTVSLGSVGLLKDFRGESILLQYYQMEFRRFLVAHFYKTNHMIDTFLSYGGYSLALNVFCSVYPSPEHPFLESELSEYRKFLADRVGYTKANTDNPHIYQSTSSVITSLQAREQLSTSKSPNYNYFTTQTELAKGHGLLAISPVTIANLRPMQQPALQTHADHKAYSSVTSFNFTPKTAEHQKTGGLSIRPRL